MSRFYEASRRKVAVEKMPMRGRLRIYVKTLLNVGGRRRNVAEDFIVSVRLLAPAPVGRTRRFARFRVVTTFRNPVSDQSIRIRFSRVYRRPYARQQQLHFSGFHLSTASIEPVRVCENLAIVLNRDGAPRTIFSGDKRGLFEKRPAGDGHTIRVVHYVPNLLKFTGHIRNLCLYCGPYVLHGLFVWIKRTIARILSWFAYRIYGSYRACCCQ